MGGRNMEVGFIGLGTMGASMAANLQKAGYRLIVHDARRQAAAPHLGAGATWAATPRDVANASEVIFTSLPGPAEVEAVALGPDGLLAGIHRGDAYFDLSTNARAIVQKLHAAFAEKGVQFLDAPVSGGPRGAASGNLALEEMTEALNRGWGDRDSRSAMLLQQERAGVKIAVDREALQRSLAADPAAASAQTKRG